MEVKNEAKARWMAAIKRHSLSSSADGDYCVLPKKKQKSKNKEVQFTELFTKLCHGLAENFDIETLDNFVLHYDGKKLYFWKRCYTWLDYLADSIYIADFLINFRVTHLDQEGIIITEPSLLHAKYFKSQKIYVDLVTILPLSLLASDFFDAMDKGLRLSLYLGLFIHWIACLYYMASEYEGLGINNWVYPNTTEFQSFESKYIRCIYWSLMTLTTIGGTKEPETNLEHVFNGVIFLIGVFLFAYVVGNVGDVIANLNCSRQEFQNRMAAIKLYMNQRNVPGYLQDTVNKWAQYSWERNQTIDDSNIIEALPHRLKSEIAVHVHLDTLKKVLIFEDSEDGVLEELVLKLKPQVYLPGDFICKKGETGREMYILNHGKVEISVPDETSGQSTVVATLSSGNYFGEISLLKLEGGQNKRTADVRSIGYSELLVLSRKDFLQTMQEYPTTKRDIEQNARERMQKNAIIKRSSTVSGDVDESEFQNGQEPSGLFRKAAVQVTNAASLSKIEQNRVLLTKLEFGLCEVRESIQSLTEACNQENQRRIAALEAKYSRILARMNLPQQNDSDRMLPNPSPAARRPRMRRRSRAPMVVPDILVNNESVNAHLWAASDFLQQPSFTDDEALSSAAETPSEISLEDELNEPFEHLM